MWVGPKLEYLYKRHRYRKDNHTKAKTGVTLLQAQEDLGPPEAGQGKDGLEGFFSRELQREHGPACSLI